MLRLFGLDLAVTRFGIGSIVFDILGGLICCFISHLLYTFSLHVQVDISLSLMDENLVSYPSPLLNILSKLRHSFLDSFLTGKIYS